MRKYIDELFLVIIDMLQDATSLPKREVRGLIVAIDRNP